MYRHLANRNEISVPGYTTATNVAVLGLLVTTVTVISNFSKTTSHYSQCNYVAAKATYIRLLFGKMGVFRP